MLSSKEDCNIKVTFITSFLQSLQEVEVQNPSLEDFVGEGKNKCNAAA